MTRDEIVKLASEASSYANEHANSEYDWSETRDMRFAALVAAAKRESCANLCRDIKPENHGVSFRDLPGWILGTLSASEAIRAMDQS